MISSLTSIASLATKNFSVNNSKFISGAVFHGGGGNTLDEPNVELNFGSGSGTIEFWFRCVDTLTNTKDGRIMYIGNNSQGIEFGFNKAANRGKISFTYMVNNSAVTSLYSDVNIIRNSWMHIAIVVASASSGYNFNLYQNGTLRSQTNITNSLGNFTAINIGNTGYRSEITGIRFSDSARYTGDFTPNNQLYVIDSNTMFCMNFVNANFTHEQFGFQVIDLLIQSFSVTVVPAAYMINNGNVYRQIFDITP
jgi:hypothetical protein